MSENKIEIHNNNNINNTSNTHTVRRRHGGYTNISHRTPSRDGRKQNLDEGRQRLNLSFHSHLAHLIVYSPKIHLRLPFISKNPKMSSTTIPPAAVAANNNTLNSALAAEQISSPASPVGKPVDEKKQLEEGEIEENPSESDSQTKTIFDDASKFNVKV